MPKNKLYGLVVCLSILAYTWIIYNSFFLINSEEGITICWFKTISGLPCPACGTTGGMVEIFKGNFLEAFHLNPFAYSSLFLLVFASIWVILDLIRKKDGFYLFYLSTNTKLKKKRIIIPIILLILSVWIWNIFKTAY